MLFKGTERRAVGEIASTVEAAGGNINAFTSFDMTVYHITMASRDAAVGIDVLADAVQHSTFDPAELAKEEEVVLEEIRRGEDSPGRVLSQAVFSAAFEKHPYRLPVIGTTESVKSFTREGLLDFFGRWYVTNNMTFVAAGDLDPEETLKTIREAFRGARSRPGLEHGRAPEPAQQGARSKIERRAFEQTLLGLAYPATAFGDDDTAYLDLLSLVLGAGDSSRLYRNVKDQAGLVHGISASAYTPLDPGLFFIDAQLDSDKLEDSLAAISVEVERMRRFGPSDVELSRARVNLLAQEVHEKETMQGQARKVGYYETIGGGLENEKRYLDLIRNATPEDIRKTAQKYLDPDRVTIGALLNEDERKDLSEDQLLAAFAVDSSSESQTQSKEIHPGIYQYVLPNGLRALIKPNPNVPLVSLRLSFMGGLLAETPQTQGINSFMTEMLERGTDTRSALQFAAEVEGIAASVDGFSGRNSFGMTADFLKDSLDTGLELFTDALLNPAFDEEEIEKLRVERLAALKRREDNLGSKAFELFAETLFRGHPYRFQMSGTPQSIGRMSRKDLQRFYDKYVNPRNGVIAVVGDVDPDRMAESLANLFAEWQSESEVALPKRKPVPAISKPIKKTLKKGKQQVHVVIGFPGLPIGHRDLPALEVLTQILSGQGGRLFLELRDKKSLAYSVTAFSIEGVDPGSFGVYIASAPTKLDESIEGLKTELQRVLDEPITKDEIERAKGYLIGSQAVSLQRFGSQASLLSLDELYGLGATHHLGYEDRIQAVTLDDVKRVAKEIIQIDRPVLVVIN